MPKALSELAGDWRLGPFQGIHLILWKPTPFPILWSIWKKMNNRIFNGESKDKEDIVFAIILKITKWVNIKKESKQLSMDNILK